MKLHEEFKLYEELWEATAGRDLYKRKMKGAPAVFDLLDKDQFMKYLDYRFMNHHHFDYLCWYPVLVRRLGAVAEREARRALQSLKSDVDTDRDVNAWKKMQQFSEWTTEYIDKKYAEYAEIEKQGKLMVAIETNPAAYARKYEFFDLANVSEVYTWTERQARGYGSISNYIKDNDLWKRRVVDTLKEEGYEDVVKELLDLISKQELKTTTSTEITDKSPDEYIEYDSFFEEFN